jgi:hypothetical protein
MAMSKEERNAYMREWRKKNRDKIRERDKKYREANKEKIKEYHKGWRDNNREHLNEKARERYKEDPQPFKERKERYVASHQEQVKESRHRYKVENRQRYADYERNKRQSDPVYRFRKGVIRLINGYAKKKGYAGGKGTWEMVGCDFDTFLVHIQSQFTEGMTIENYGNGEGCWNIDHIIPICTAETDEDIERLNHYLNLRPLWATENCRRARKTP